MPFDFATYRSLTHEYGPAFFLLDERAFVLNVNEILAAFQTIYPRTSLGYSYKTNYLPRLCQIVQSQGQYAEVVSAMEYELARRLGVPGERIIFNGPLKLEPELSRAMLEGRRSISMVPMSSNSRHKSRQDIASVNSSLAYVAILIWASRESHGLDSTPAATSSMML